MPDIRRGLLEQGAAFQDTLPPESSLRVRKLETLGAESRARYKTHKPKLKQKVGVSPVAPAGDYGWTGR